MIAKLIRIATSDRATFGNIIIDNQPLCTTLELPWNDNQDFISCIPAGVYQCIKSSSAKYPIRFEILDVPDRDDILIHNGNWAHETQGCIIAGSGFGKDMVTSSNNAMKKLKKELPDVFVLEIINGYNI